MTLLPVIERELRVQSRRAFTYWLRVLGLVILLFVGVSQAAKGGTTIDHGGRLFGYLNTTLFFTIWILVPLVTADCISSERREGTLGLLFLTPLRARNIVLAKGVVHGLRALTLWIAVLPALTIPFLLGGVTWTELVLSVLINFGALCCALAAGILASSRTKVWLRSLLLAGILGTLFFLVFVSLNDLLAREAWRGLSPAGINYYNPQSVSGVILEGTLLSANFAGSWGDWLRRLVGTGQRSWIMAEAKLALVALATLILAIELAAHGVRRGWQDQPPSARQLWWREKLCTPVLWVSFFHGLMRRKIERNPIGWLEQRAWSGRLATWGWLAVIISIYSAALTDSRIFTEGDLVERTMGWLLLGNMAVSAAGSFRRERESGLLELLLVSPVPEEKIIWGRLRGLWGQFLPAWCLLVGVWLYFLTFATDPQISFRSIWFFAIAFLTLPIVGLYYSLKRNNFFGALLFTVLMGLFLPKFSAWELSRAAALGNWRNPEPVFPILLLTIMQILVAVIFVRLLHHDLVGRKFPLQRSVT